MSPLPRLTAWLTLAVVAVLALGLYGREQRARGRAEAQLVALRAANDSLRGLQARVDTVYARDTLRLWRTVRALDTLTVTVDAWKHDTVEVVRFVARADSVVQACIAAVRSCEERNRLWGIRYANLERQVAALPKPRAAFWVWAERVVLVGVSVELGRALAR